MGCRINNFDRINVKDQLSMINDQFMQGVGGNAKKNLDRINVKDQLLMINDQFMQGVGGNAKKNLDRMAGFI